jgi:hypothetical protein
LFFKRSATELPFFLPWREEFHGEGVLRREGGDEEFTLTFSSGESLFLVICKSGSLESYPGIHGDLEVQEEVE